MNWIIKKCSLLIFSIEKLLFNRFLRFFDFGMIDGKEKGWIEFMELFCIEKFTKIKKRLDQTKGICKNKENIML